MQLPPLEVIQSWPKANLVNPVDHGPGNIIMIGILYPIVMLMLFTRIYTRLCITKSFGLDDWMICASWLPATAFAVLALIADVKFKWTRHVWDVPIDTIALSLKFMMATQAIYGLAQTLTKLSMLAFVHRTVRATGGRLKLVTEVAAVVIGLQGLIFIIVIIFQCRPVHLYWSFSFLSQPKCINERAHLLAASTINTVADIFVVCLPISIVSRMNMPMRQKILVNLLFGAGAAVCIASSLRAYYTWAALSVPGRYDSTWNIYPIWLSSSVELFIGMIGASVPATKAFFQRFFPKFFNSFVDTQNHSADDFRDPNIQFTIGPAQPNRHQSTSITTLHEDSERNLDIIFSKE